MCEPREVAMNRGPIHCTAVQCVVTGHDRGRIRHGKPIRCEGSPTVWREVRTRLPRADAFSQPLAALCNAALLGCAPVVGECLDQELFQATRAGSSPSMTTWHLRIEITRYANDGWDVRDTLAGSDSQLPEVFCCLRK